MRISIGGSFLFLWSRKGGGAYEKRSIKVYGQSGYKYWETPTIMLKGMWLKEAGFDVGDYISVTCEDGKIVIAQDAERAAVKAVEAEFMDREMKALQKRYEAEKMFTTEELSFRDLSLVSLNHTREERGLLGVLKIQWIFVSRRPERSGDPSRVGAGEISIGKAPRERRWGHACKIAKCKTGVLTIVPSNDTVRLTKWLICIWRMVVVIIENNICE